jgi:hypothetical protein
MTTATQCLSNLNCEVHADLMEDGRCTCSVVVAKVPTPGPVLVRPKQRYTIMCDANNRYFFIPTDKEQQFEAWVSTGRANDDYGEFDDFRVEPMGAITKLIFLSHSLVN